MTLLKGLKIKTIVFILTCQLVQIFITFNRTDISFFKEVNE